MPHTYTGDLIRKYRKEKGWTQKQLGEACGIHEANIRKYELGMQNPKKETLQKIAAALDVSSLDIGIIPDSFRNAVNELEDLGVKAFFSNPSFEESEIFHYLGFLNAEGQKKVLEYTTDIAKIPEFAKDEEQALRNYLDFIKDKDSNYWNEFRKTLLKIEAPKSDEDSGESTQ